MKVKELLGASAERNRSAIIKDCRGTVVAKGTVWNIFNNKALEELLKMDVDCFFFSIEKLYITIK